ncbi:MAG: hypothetical protein P8J37_04035 [Fuerstiella sp.]|nr:hypothetical protein [Fuerstiella sp.]
MARSETDQNLMFGLIAMQSDLIDMSQFVDACTLWGSRKETSLSTILVEQGWLLPEDREHVEYLLKRRVQKAGGDVAKSLSGMSDNVKVALEGIGDGDIRSLLSGLR